MANKVKVKERMEVDESILEEVDISELEDVLNTKKLVLHNDDHNTFQHVIVTIMRVLKYELERAEQITYLIHYKQRANAKTGDYDQLKPFKDAFTDAGIRATIE